MKKQIDATGVILAGGMSQRFGRDKALEPMGGKPLIEWTVEAFKQLFPRLLIGANEPEKYGHLNIVIRKDLIRGFGPLGGIYTGLSCIKDFWGFFAACDMPFINPNLVRYMAELRAGSDIVAPRIVGYIEPLHAFYCRRCLGPIRELIDAGKRQIILFYEQVRVRYVDEQEIRKYDPQFKSFFNVNWPQDLPPI